MRRPIQLIQRFVLFMAGLLTLSGCTGVQILNNLAPTEAIRPVISREYDPDHHLALDIYPPTHAEQAPVIIFFGGGRWEDGD